MLRTRLALVAIAAAGLLAACGSSKTATTATTTAAAAASAAGRGSAPGASTGQAPGTLATETTLGSSTTVGAGSDPNSPYCTAFKGYKDAETKLDSVFSESKPDPAAATPVVADVDQKMTALEGAAPAEIKADVANIAKPRHEVLDLVVANKFDLDALQSDSSYTALAEQFDTDAMAAAVDRVHGFNTSTCGLDQEF